jgi:hypothetical protein
MIDDDEKSLFTVSWLLLMIAYGTTKKYCCRCIMMWDVDENGEERA